MSLANKSVSKKGLEMENKGIEAKVIELDGTETVYHYAPHPGRWGQLNEFYGKLVQQGIIKTVFMSLTH